MHWRPLHLRVYYFCAYVSFLTVSQHAPYMLESSERRVQRLVKTRTAQSLSLSNRSCVGSCLVFSTACLNDARKSGKSLECLRTGVS